MWCHRLICGTRVGLRPPKLSSVSNLWRQNHPGLQPGQSGTEVLPGPVGLEPLLLPQVFLVEFLSELGQEPASQRLERKVLPWKLACFLVMR